MLRILSITLSNFGPFKGKQTITFPTEDGVVIIYGENGRGKTTLLNAIRYGLFGKVLGRGSRSISVHKIGNWEAFEEGMFGFEIELLMAHAEGKYKLTRTCKARTGIVLPTSDDDYVQQVFLALNGNILGPEEAKAHLSRIMPEQVSRFFLFDGELLQEYEELLYTESESAQKIKSSIEKILGVPILTSARAHLGDLLKEAQTAESKQAQKLEKTQIIGHKLAETFAQRNLMEAELKEASHKQVIVKNQKSSLEEQRKRNERVARGLKEREELVEKCARIEQKIKEKTEIFREHARDAWQTVLRPKIAILRSEVQNAIAEFESKNFAQHLIHYQAEQLSKASLDGHCPVCATALSAQTLENLQQVLNQKLPDAPNEESEKLRKLRLLQDSLLTFHALDKRDVLNELVNDIGDLKAERASSQDKINEIDETIGQANESDVRRIERDFETAVKDLSTIERAIQKLSEELGSLEQAITKLEGKLDETSGNEMQADRNRRETYSQLSELFSEGVSAYRDSLREKVSESSTELFRLFCGDPDYESLTINSNYGLSIQHRDKSMIDLRSAGYEHLIALSLMGSLQRCSPLRGPIIMDSPAGRLDGIHKKKVTESLSKISPQVLLLVFKDELSPTKAREYLKGSLVDEYMLVRKSAKFTTIEKVLGE